MGCSASTQSGGLGGGLYGLPNDDDDMKWNGQQNEMNYQNHHQHTSSSSHHQHVRTNGTQSQIATGGSSMRKRKSIERRQQQQQPFCENTTFPSSFPCQNTYTESPQRRPYPNEDHGAVGQCSNERIDAPSSSSSKTMQKKTQPLCCRETSYSTNDHLHTDTYPRHTTTTSSHTTTDIIMEEETEIPSTPTIFSSRQWLVLPEQKYDMDTLHPVMPPFLGSMYWTAASPPQLQQPSSSGGGRKQIGQGYDELSLQYIESGDSLENKFIPTFRRSPLDDSGTTDECSPFTRFGIQEEEMSAQQQPRSKKRVNKLLLSLASTEEEEGEWQTGAASVSTEGGRNENETAHDENYDEFPTATQEEESFLNNTMFSPHEKQIDLSREILDYSTLDESYVLAQKRSHVAPHKLFDGDEDNMENDVVMDPIAENSLLDGMLDESFEIVTTSTPSRQQQSRGLHSFLCMAPQLDGVMSSNGNTEKARVVTPPNMAPPESPNVATFHTQGGQVRERHVSTLPSQSTGQPIRLRVTDKSSHRGASADLLHSMSSTHSPGDYFSYDPYFNSGKYTITLPNGRPYGNSLVIKMGMGQFMILQDSRGVVLAVIKTRHTHTPSTVVYAPKPRYANQMQAPSGHRLTRRVTNKHETIVVVDGDDNDDGEALYPWALITKSGRTMEDDCSVHLVSDNAKAGAKNTSSGIFNSEPTFRGRHAFDRQLHTHTVVSRVIASENGNRSTPLEGAEIPCCVIVRDSSNLDAVDLSVAPGVDPLLMICYLASHSKMDIEPLLSGY